MSCCRRNRRRCCRSDWENSNRNCRCDSMNDYNMWNNCSDYDNQNRCRNNSAFPENYMYGHAYTPRQTMDRTFSPEEGLQNGTIFPELVSPYYPGQSMEIIEYLRNDRGNGGCGCE